MPSPWLRSTSGRNGARTASRHPPRETETSHLQSSPVPPAIAVGGAGLYRVGIGVISEIAPTGLGLRSCAAASSGALGRRPYLVLARSRAENLRSGYFCMDGRGGPPPGQGSEKLVLHLCQQGAARRVRVPISLLPPSSGPRCRCFCSLSTQALRSGWPGC